MSWFSTSISSLLQPQESPPNRQQQQPRPSQPRPSPFASDSSRQSQQQPTWPRPPSVTQESIHRQQWETQSNQQSQEPHHRPETPPRPTQSEPQHHPGNQYQPIHQYQPLQESPQPLPMPPKNRRQTKNQNQNQNQKKPSGPGGDSTSPNTPLVGSFPGSPGTGTPQADGTPTTSLITGSGGSGAGNTGASASAAADRDVLKSPGLPDRDDEPLKPKTPTVETVLPQSPTVEKAKGPQSPVVDKAKDPQSPIVDKAKDPPSPVVSKGKDPESPVLGKGKGKEEVGAQTGGENATGPPSGATPSTQAASVQAKGSGAKSDSLVSTEPASSVVPLLQTTGPTPPQTSPQATTTVIPTTEPPHATSDTTKAKENGSTDPKEGNSTKPKENGSTKPSENGSTKPSQNGSAAHTKSGASASTAQVNGDGSTNKDTASPTTPIKGRKQVEPLSPQKNKVPPPIETSTGPVPHTPNVIPPTRAASNINQPKPLPPAHKPVQSRYDRDLLQRPPSPSLTAVSGVTHWTALPPQPKGEEILEALESMKETSDIIKNAFEKLKNTTSKVSQINMDFDPKREIDSLKRHMDKQDNRQEEKMSEIKGLLKTVLQDQVLPHVQNQIVQSIDERIDLQVEEQVRIQLANHLPQGLQDQVEEYRKQLDEVAVSLQNAESRRHNAMLRSHHLEDPLHELRKPDGTVSKYFPRTLALLFELEGPAARALVLEYGLPNVGESRERNLNRFMQFCGVAYQMVPTAALA